MFNNFLSVSAEPGPGSKYFNFTGSPGLSMWNTVIGHDNTYAQCSTKHFSWSAVTDLINGHL